MKVIRVSNYDDGGPRGTQRVVKGSLTFEEAEKLANEMNSDPRRSDEDWFRAVPDNELLFVFEP
jgi:hypothetical protein